MSHARVLSSPRFRRSLVASTIAALLVVGATLGRAIVTELGNVRALHAPAAVHADLAHDLTFVID